MFDVLIIRFFLSSHNEARSCDLRKDKAFVNEPTVFLLTFSTHSLTNALSLRNRTEKCRSCVSRLTISIHVFMCRYKYFLF